MAMADGVKLFKGLESHNEEEKKSPYDYQLTEASALDNSVMLDNELDNNANKPQNSLISSQKLNLVEDSNNDLCEVVGEGGKDFCYERTTTHASIVKRTRGRPRKDCHRPAKHHLGQSMATKVFPGRPRFRGRKQLQHYFLTHSAHKLQDVQTTTLDVYDDIDSDLKSSNEIPGKLQLVLSEAVPDNELKIEKYCALCNLSEKSLLGQGKLKHFKPSEGFNCFEEMEERVKDKSLQVTQSSESGSELKLFFKKQKIINRSGESVRLNRSKSFPEKSSLLNDLIQELELTGFKTMPDGQEVFEPTGEVYAHFNCAAWSDGVTKTFENLLSNVDKAVVSAALQKCSKCNRYGASVRCCVSECSKIYHYPCAIVSGALQNANCFKIICSIHLEDAFSFGVICMACHESGDLSQLLLCTSCSNYYHGTCMDPPIVPSPDLRAGWQCLDCKVCQNCRQPVESSKMIMCNTCDKAYHTFCVKPAISSVPKSGWKCSACRMCGDCGARTPGNGPSSRWHMNYSVCDSCYQQRNKGIACPLCGKAYRQFSQRKAMKHCTLCQKYIHEECDKRSRRNSMDYVCPLCSSADVKNIEGGDLPIKDNFLTSSRDSFLSDNEISLSSDSEDAHDGVHSKIGSRRTPAGDNTIKPKKSFKPKYKSFSIPNFLLSLSAAASKTDYKMDDDDPTEDNKLILASATDEFVLCQDLCVMCGSFGRGEEGRLIVCAQCGQCYHSYCVSVKVTTVVLKKGWRCLDCTVCEGCGQPHDEGRLLLCDECDISFHIYCLDPPLQEVPQGNWKCKWCVNCVRCGSKSAGLNCSWQMNYTLCGPCASYSSCAICNQHYDDNELVIQCSKCERWLHCMCDQIEDEEQAERCAEYGYNCPHCRPPDELPPHLMPMPRTPTPEIEPVPERPPTPVKPKEPVEVPPPPPPVVTKTKHPVQFFVDGVCLSESGMQHIKSLAPDQPKKIPRPRKMKHLSLSSSPFSLHTAHNEDSTSAIVAPEEIKTETLSVEELAMKAYDFEEGRLVIDSTASEDKKKRPRKLQKLGIGGFSVKPRGNRIGKDFVGETEAGAFEGFPALEMGNAPQLTAEPASEIGGEKPKRKRKPKKKTHLDESFPSYLRDAFFGRDLLLSCKKSAKSGDGHEDPMKEEGRKGSTEPSDMKAPFKEEKDFPPAIGKNRDVNVTYKSIIKSEIESIKEEHLSSTSNAALHDTPVFSSGPKVSSLYLSSAPAPGAHAPNFQHPDSNSSWPDSECDQSQMQKSLLKWESDEQLGLLSTISPVLYANINLPHLKIEFPAWADRVKQIAKIWRGLPPEKRQPYLQRARENRAASRTQRSSSTESDKSQSRESSSRVSSQESEQERQWKQLQAMRQMQHQNQQRLYQEQRQQQQQQQQQAILKSQAEKSSSLTAVDLEKKLYHSKSLSEIPQFAEEGKEGRKVFEKRWSSSAIDLNTAQTIMQIKREPDASPVHSSFQNAIMNANQQNVIQRNLHASSLETQFSLPDTLTSPLKKIDPFHGNSPLHQTVHKPPLSSSSVLIGQDEVVKGMADKKEMTSPSLPRPHSSDSFFQASASPQSQLLASMDSHSQPTPATSKMLGQSVIQSPKTEQGTAESLSLPPKITQPAPGASPNHPQQLQPAVEQFVLQSPLTSANLVKQLSQYKETFGSIGSTARTLLTSSDKATEQQKLEQFLKEGLPTYPSKQQQLKDLLQSKEESKEAGQATNQNVLSSSGTPEVCSISDTTTTTTTTTATAVAVEHVAMDTAKSSFSGGGAPQESTKGQVAAEQESQQAAADDFLNADSNAKGGSVLDALVVSNKKEEEEGSGLNKSKRKTTAADLVKDLETQPDEDHDVITSGCNLDVLPGDVGELELDDDELLGLGNDFNILEYADPELDKSLVGEGDKNNILDEHLDLDDKDEELEDDVIKEADQEKDLISQEEDKESEKLSKDPDSSNKDADTFLNYDKKDTFESSFDTKSLSTPTNNPPVEHLPSLVKEEAKPIFSSCSLSSQTYTPNVDVKLEKRETSENCPTQKSHPLPFGPENQAPQLQCAEPPSYRMVTALKQAVVTHQPTGPMVHHNKSLFPLHINMNMREHEQSILSTAADEAKPLLLQEQPLLLAELVEQEKREQRRQTQEGMISPHGDALLSDIDFERLKDDVFSGPPDDSLAVPGSLLGSHDTSMNISSNFGPPPYSLLWQNQDPPRNVAHRPPNITAGFIPNLKKASVSAVISSLGLQSTSLAQKTQIVSGNPNAGPLHPNFVAATPPMDPHIDPEKLKLMTYEKQLLHQQAQLSNQQKYFETEVIRLRKMKKALNAKQRQLRKNGSELTETDSVELARVSQEQAGLQKQLDQVRKQTRQNTVALQDYRLKQQKRQQQQQPQPVSAIPHHAIAVNSVQPPPQNSNQQQVLQFAPASLPSPSVSVRLPTPPSPQSAVGAMFSAPLQMVKSENKAWPPSQVESSSISEQLAKKEPVERPPLPQQSFPLHQPQNEVTLKGLVEVKKRFPEDVFKQSSSDSSSSLLTTAKTEEQDSLINQATPAENASSQNQLIKEQKEDPVSSVSSPVPQSILSQSLPSSVSNTLKFTLRQTGMPTVCLPPTDSNTENAPEMPYPVAEDAQSKSDDVKPPQTAVQNPEKVKEESSQGESVLEKKIKEERTEEKVKEEVDSAQGAASEVTKNDSMNASSDAPLIHIKQEIIDDDTPETAPSSQPPKQQKEGDNEGSSDEELVNINKPAPTEAEQGGEQNVLLKQLLQNCPSADTPRKPDSFIGLRKEENDDLDKLELPFDVNDPESKSKLAKKPTYLDIRRAQLEKEPTPPPGEKPKLTLKRKRVKKKKLEDPNEGGAVKKKCRRTSSKIEEGYENYVENLMNKLTSLPPLRILEPNIKPNFSAIPVFGAGDLNVKESQLKGCYGDANIPNQHDVYSFHPFTKEKPSSSSLLPPSSPPYRGFYNQEFPAVAKAFEKNELPVAIRTPLESEPLKTLREAGSPDTVLSSSSPECCLAETQNKWPKLVFVDKILPEVKRNMSPVIPLMYPIPIRLFPKEWDEFDKERDKENIPEEKPEMGLLKNKMSGVGGYSAPLKDSGNVAVTLTLSSAAAEDICGVLSALAELLKIPIPASYEIVERTATPPSQKLGLYRHSKNNDVSIHSLLNGKPRFCRHCDIVVLSAGIRKKAVDLSLSKEEQEEEEVIFCSTNCYMQFALTHQATAILEEKEVAAVVDHVGGSMYDKYEDSLGVPSILGDSKGDAICGMLDDIKSEKMASDNIQESLQDNPDRYNPYDIDLLNDDKMDICEEMPSRKWKSIKYKYWRSDFESTKSKRKDDEKSARPFYHTIKPGQMPKDERKCIFCHLTGDGDTNGAARLLNMDVNKWVHLNCALWSYEVYETVNGALMNVEVAFKRSRHLNCYNCHKPGASVRCFKTRCPNVYHFPCARKEQCAFYKDKTVLCSQHIHKGNPENRLDSVAVFRRVYINREEHKQVASMIQDEKYVMRIGSLIFLNIGQLLPQQLPAFHNTNCIYPVGYKVIRMYWSMRKLGRRSQYICTINEVCGKPEFTIQVKDTDVILKDNTAKGVWQKVLYPIEKMRKQAKTIKMFPDFITGDDLFGLTEPAVLRIIESLPGVDTLCDYNFRYGRSPFLELPLAINPTGCARSEPKLRTHFKRPHTLHTSSTQRSFQLAFASFYPEQNNSSPYIKQFVHSKSSQYRKMKTEWRNNVYLARSRIQGLGLYAARDMERHTMVIEYIGQLIRNEIAERNEAIYNAQNRGVYMFRLDENRVIDATLSGGLARYINHSCNPNCVTEAVQIDRENKIIIITNRKVLRGEELSYDYKFEVEDDQNKIPCLCGAPNCRKWMN